MLRNRILSHINPNSASIAERLAFAGMDVLYRTCPAQLGRFEAIDAAERRGAGTLWTEGPVAWECVSVGAVDQPEVVPVADDAGAANPQALPRAVAVRGMGSPRIAEEAPTALLTAILARLEMGRFLDRETRWFQGSEASATPRALSDPGQPSGSRACGSLTSWAL